MTWIGFGEVLMGTPRDPIPDPWRPSPGRPRAEERFRPDALGRRLVDIVVLAQAPRHRRPVRGAVRLGDRRVPSSVPSLPPAPGWCSLVPDPVSAQPPSRRRITHSSAPSGSSLVPLDGLAIRPSCRHRRCGV